MPDDPYAQFGGSTVAPAPPKADPYGKFGGSITINPNQDFSVDPNAPGPAKPQVPPRNGVIGFTEDTLSNIPASAGKFVGNIAHAVAHPVDTGKGLLDVATGTIQKMNPSAVPQIPGGESDKRAYADAAWSALKERYGSPHAIAESIRTDPVGVAADISALAGGVSGAVRGGAAVADAANLPRVASAANTVADTAATVSDAANPLMLAGKGAGLVAEKLPTPKVPSSLNPLEAASVNFADQQGIPLNLGTRTGNVLAKGAQVLSKNMLGGGTYAQDAERAGEQALARTGDRIASSVSPVAANADQATAGVVGDLNSKIAGLHAQANTEYGKLRAIEQDPANWKKVQVGVHPDGSPLMQNVPLPVDMRGVKGR